MRRIKIHNKVRFMTGITVLAAVVLNGCGDEFADEPETTIEIDFLFEDISADESIIDLSTENAFDENASNESEPTGAAGQETLESASTEEESGEFWRKQYEAVLKNWTLIENYGDMSYLSMYFGEDYAFDSYWLCDVDQNQVPELFLHSSTMDVITAVLTCTEEKLVFLTYDNFYGINLETGELVIQGHWHGSGGTGENEWTAYKVFPDKAKNVMYIDHYDLSEYGEEDRYVIYNPETDEYGHVSDGTEYGQLYAVHVEPCITVDYYTLYDISDLSGLDSIQ